MIIVNTFCLQFLTFTSGMIHIMEYSGLNSSYGYEVEICQDLYIIWID